MGCAMKTTKKEILDAALTVFSRDGYEGAKLADIAGLLGITKGALYKHYDGKEALWNAMIASIETYYGERIGTAADIAVPETLDGLKELSLRQINFTLHDDTIRRVRKILTIGQYRNEHIRDLAVRHFMSDMEELYARIFSGMIGSGLLKDADAGLLAFEYTSPITGLIHLCDIEPDREKEVMERIEKHIELFCSAYGR